MPPTPFFPSNIGTIPAVALLVALAALACYVLVLNLKLAVTPLSVGPDGYPDAGSRAYESLWERLLPSDRFDWIAVVQSVLIAEILFSTWA